MTKGEFLTAYLEDRRRRELQILEELLPRLTDAERKIWMVTLVTKQDIWWKDRSQVEDYYLKGEYGQRIKEIAQKRGERNFPHTFLSASLVMNNFVSGRGELLAPTTEGYDQNIRLANLQQLVETASTFAKR